MENTHPTAAEIKLMLHRCGLSQTEAAEFLGKEARTVRRWISGDFEIPPENWRSLSELCDRLDQAAREKMPEIEKKAAKDGEAVTVNLARTDEEAHRLGYPCAGAQLAVARRLVEWAPKGVRIVPAHRDLDQTQQEVIRLRNFLRNH